MIELLRRISPWVLLSLAACSAAACAQVPSSPRLSGYVQARESFQNSTGLSASLNRVRLGADGSLPSGFGYRVLVEYEAAAATGAATVSLRDAYLRWTRAPWAIQVGQYKTPFSREYLTSITQIDAADRPAVVDALAPKRDIGVMGEASLPFGGAWVGVFNGEGQNVGVNRDSTNMVVGRVVVRPLSLVSIAANAAAYGGDSTRFGFEGSAEWRGFLARGEWIAQRRRDRNDDDRGWFALAGYRARPWLQVIARLEDFEQPTFGPQRRSRATTLGANVDLPGGRVRLLANYVSRRLGDPHIRRGWVITQAQVRF